ncbi:MAG: universal stress protein [Halobacteriales archaeon]
MSRPTVLLPVLFPDPEFYPVSETLIEEFSGFDIVLFGHWEVPAEVGRDEARNRHRTEADAVLYEFAAEFSRAGARTDVQLHFGPPRDGGDELRDRIAEQTHADAILVPNPFSALGQVLVPIRDARNQPKLIEIVGTLNEQTVIDLELFHLCADESEKDEAQEMLETVREGLIERGFPELEVETIVEVGDDPAYAISERARAHDLVIMGETAQPDYKDQVFGPVYEFVADRSEDPIMVVREDEP